RNKDSQISVYPNPATDEITIDYPKNLAAETIDLIRILDGNGRAVLEIKNHPKDQPVSVEGISRGSYILKVNSGGIEFSSKLLIQ
ncbi:T9SS type A sorting domain-containing protein, partial [Halocola ammonii]